MRIARLALVCWAAMALPLPAAAQETDSEDIVVTGRTEQPKRSDVDRQARDVTAPGALYDMPLARFEDRFCPGIIGMREDYAALMIDRLRYNANDLGIRLADDENCSPNFVVVLAQDGQAQIAELERRHGYLFASLSLPERRALLAETGPVRVWTTTQMRTRDGMPVPTGEGLSDPPVVNTWMAHSKIYLAIRQDITSVMVLFDIDQVQGKTLVQLADYATMRGLAQTKPVEGGAPLDTILALFDGENAGPDELTGFDRAYLRSVYDWIPNLPGITKLLGINRQLRLAAEEREQAQGAVHGERTQLAP